MEKVRTLHETSKAKLKAHVKQVKDVAKVNIQKIKDLDALTKKRVLLIGFGVGISNFALSLFSIYTLMSFAIMAGCLALFLKVNFDEIKKKGLIFYIPPKYHEVLLERSLFDIICDVWFIPKITIYLKALISPFILKIEPNEAIHQFKEFSPGARKAILTKGLVNIMPGFVRGIMLPPVPAISQESENSSTLESHEQEVVKGGDLSENDDGSNRSTSVPRENEAASPQIAKSLVPKGFLNTSTDDDSLVNHHFLGPASSLRDGNKHVRVHKQKGRTGPRIEKKFLHDSETDLASSLLADKKKSPVHKVKISETWDKLELFAKMRREKLIKQKLLEKHSGPLKMEFKGPLQKLQNLSLLLNKDALISKLEGPKLTKIFLISTIALLLQFSLSKRTRLWCYNTVHILLYITGFTVSTGSMAMLGLKMQTSYKQWKEKKKNEIVQALKEGAEGDDEQ
jgi:hypothetical protein